MKHLITFPDITARTEVAKGGEAHKFNVVIPQTEQRYLRPVLGQVLFGELLNFVQAPLPDETDVLFALATECKDMLSAWAVVEAWPSLLGHIEAAGYVTKVGERSTGTSTADVQLADRTLANLESSAKWRTGELTAWLTTNAADYPSWIGISSNTTAAAMPVGGIDF